MLLLKPYDQPVGRGRQKTQGRFDQKKIFFDFFMLRRLESVFQGERKIFLKKIFLKFFRKKILKFLKESRFWDFIFTIFTIWVRKSESSPNKWGFASLKASNQFCDINIEEVESILYETLRWKLFVRASVFFPKEQMKNTVKISFLAGPNQKLHTGAFALVIKRGPAKFQYDALKLGEKTFVSEVQSFLNTQFE